VAVFSLAVITAEKCRLLCSSYSSVAFESRRHVELYRGSQSFSAFQTTFYSAVPLPQTHADADVFPTSLPRQQRHHEVVDCFDARSTTPRRDTHSSDPSSHALIGNGRCPADDPETDNVQSLPVRVQRQQRHAPRAAVLLRSVEHAFLPGSVVALLLTVAAVLCIDSIALSLDVMARTLVNVEVLEALVERGIDDSAASVNAFSNFLNAELTSPLCVDSVDLNVFKLTSLLHRRRSNVAGTVLQRRMYRLIYGVHVVTHQMRNKLNSALSWYMANSYSTEIRL